MGHVYEVVTCKGCGEDIALQELSGGERHVYFPNPNFADEITCNSCGNTFTYVAIDLRAVELNEEIPPA
jgi:hypothetical protein